MLRGTIEPIILLSQLHEKLTQGYNGFSLGGGEGENLISPTEKVNLTH